MIRAIDLMLCHFGFHDWETTPTGWGEYTVSCRRCPKTHNHLEEGDW